MDEYTCQDKLIKNSMRKYYLHDGEQQTGPFSLEELAEKPLTSTTTVWYQGLDDWQEAASIEELLPIINHSMPARVEEVLPPPFKGARPPGVADQATAFRQEKPPAEMPADPIGHSPRRHSAFRSGLLKFIIVFALLIISGAAIHTVQQYRVNRIAMGSDSTAVEPTYEEQVLSIEDQEKVAPKKFLKASGTYKKTVFGGNFKIDGTVANTATVAKFKNVVIEVNFYNDKNKYIRSERYTIEDTFPAGSTKEFKLKIDPPKGADNCKWKAVAATAY